MKVGFGEKKIQTCMPKAWLILHPYPRIYFFYLQTDPYRFIINLKLIFSEIQEFFKKIYIYRSKNMEVNYSHGLQ